jgi:hypothetical protein
MLRFFLATLVAAALAVALGTGVGSADERWIIEPGPEAVDAQKSGAADVARAQKLAKDKHFAEAAAVLEDVARKWPAAVHDCNLALAYLRNNALTRAQLVWDLGALRNGARPKWCTGDVSTQLSEALHKAGYVPTTIDVSPPDAIVEVNGIAMRSMRTIWLAPGTATFNASAPGRLPKAVQASIAAPTSRVTILLEEPRVEPPAPPDAAVPVVAPPPVTPDAGVAAVPAEPDAGVPSGGSPIVINGRRLSWKRTALVATLTFSATSVLLGYFTWDAKNKADALYVTDPKFAEQKQSYDDFALSTTVLSAMAVVSAAVLVYLSVTDDDASPGTVKVGGGPGDIGISFSGTFGDGQ